jgi:hypothetical protein
MNEEKLSIITPADLMNATPYGRLEALLRSSFNKTIGERPFAEIMQSTEKKSNAKNSNTKSPQQTPMVFVETTSAGMSFDEAFSRLRMLLGALPSRQREKLLPILVERIAKRVKPEDVEDFKTLGYSLQEERENKDDILKTYLPILLIFSLLRSN